MKTAQYIAPEKIAKLLEVDPADVEKWIEGRILTAVELPDGRRRVLASSLGDFLVVYTIGFDPAPIERGRRGAS